MDKLAVLIPCYNEEQTIASVVNSFTEQLPEAVIYVYDNNSTDATCQQARAAGAIVRKELKQGKGHVVRRMFADIDAEVYVMVDGDATYDASSIWQMIECLQRDQLDMVVGVRRLYDETAKQYAYRRGHIIGNKMLTRAVGLLFGTNFNDMLSGYRVFSRRFVKSFPAISGGFEIETEITVHAQELQLATAEIDTAYFARPVGSESKLSTYRDGGKILIMILLMLKDYKPVIFFGIGFILLSSLSLLLGVPIINEFFATGFVLRFPTALLAASMMLLAFLALACGFILDSVARSRREFKRLSYLSVGLPAYFTFVEMPARFTVLEPVSE